MILTDLNRAGGIGSNSLLVEVGPFRLVVDAGIHPKLAGSASLPQFRAVEPGSLDFVVLTHCHLDHLGGLPVLLRGQPEAEVLASLPSCTIAPRMLRNSVHVMGRQRAELGLPELPLYTSGEVKRAERQFAPMAYGRPRTFSKRGESLEVTFFAAGHVAGAAGFRLVHKHRKIFFTGDVLFAEQRTLTGARFPSGPFDTLVMETTHGAKERAAEVTREGEVGRLVETIDHIVSHGGSCLIPVFALGRMQELMVILEEARRSRRLRPCPIYCAGLGMAVVDLFDEIARKTSLVNFRRKVLASLKVEPLPADLGPGAVPRGPGIYLVSSGMMVANTPSYRAAAGLLESHRNAICFVGYCDPDTPGGKLVATAPGEDFVFEALDFACKVNAHIEKFDLSGHAERDELLGFARAADPRAVVLTHGDPPARDWFHDELLEGNPKLKVVDPEPLVACTV